MIYANYVNSLTFDTGPTIIEEIGSTSADHIPIPHIYLVSNINIIYIASSNLYALRTLTNFFFNRRKKKYVVD